MSNLKCVNNTENSNKPITPNKMKEYLEHQKRLLESAMKILHVMEQAQKRIDVRNEYNRNKNWQKIYPENIAQNIKDNKVTAMAIVRLHKSYKRIINQLNK